MGMTLEEEILRRLAWGENGRKGSRKNPWVGADNLRRGQASEGDYYQYKGGTILKWEGGKWCWVKQ